MRLRPAFRPVPGSLLGPARHPAFAAKCSQLKQPAAAVSSRLPPCFRTGQATQRAASLERLVANSDCWQSKCCANVMAPGLSTMPARPPQ
jgi:hypothetical protein